MQYAGMCASLLCGRCLAQSQTNAHRDTRLSVIALRSLELTLEHAIRVSEVRAFTSCWSVCLRFSTFSCFVFFFTNILISSGRFARREAKYTSCIFRTANTDGDRVTVFHRWPQWTHCCVCERITRMSVLVFVEDKYDRSLCLRPLLF